MIPYTWFKEAEERIAPFISTTPLQYDPNLDVYLKLENRQVTGSFKVRGAINKVLTLEHWELKKGLVAASAGNHGQGVALAGKLFDIPVTIFVSDNATPTKVQAMRDLGASIEVVAGGYGEAELAGREYSTTHDSTWVSPYNDGQVIAGQGTLGLEILLQLPDIKEATWVVPVGGGGLISGICAAVEADLSNHPERKKVFKYLGVQSDASPFFHKIYYHGSQDEVLELPSLADGLAGPVEKGSVTIPLVKHFVDGLVLVSESQIEDALYYAWVELGERIEGSAGAALAAVISGKISTRPLVIVLTGSNIQPEIHEEIISRRTVVQQ